MNRRDESGKSEMNFAFMDECRYKRDKYKYSWVYGVIALFGVVISVETPTV